MAGLGGSLCTFPSSRTWLRTCRTPFVARRSATSTLAFCTQTLWKAARRAQPQVGTGRHLRVGVAPTEGLMGTQAPKEASSLPQAPSDSGPTRWAHRPPARPMPERNGAHANKAGQASPCRAVASGPEILHFSRSGRPIHFLRPALQGKGTPISSLGDPGPGSL